MSDEKKKPSQDAPTKGLKEAAAALLNHLSVQRSGRGAIPEEITIHRGPEATLGPIDIQRAAPADVANMTIKRSTPVVFAEESGNGVPGLQHAAKALLHTHMPRVSNKVLEPDLVTHKLKPMSSEGKAILLNMAKDNTGQEFDRTELLPSSTPLNRRYVPGGQEDKDATWI